jgi:hypothetical protein
MNAQYLESSTSQLSHGSRRSLPWMAILASVLLLSWSCDDGMRSAVTAPGPTPPGGSAATYTLTGTVSERVASGLSPVQGVIVLESKSRQQVTTDARGFYQLAGLSATGNSITATKEGYTAFSRTFDMNRDEQLDMEMSRIQTYVLSGTIFDVAESGRLPIQGVSVYCDSCGDPLGHTFAKTDANGFYSFSYTKSGQTPLIVTKDGYRLAGNPPPGPIEGWIVATVNGDTRFDIEIVRR